MSVAEHRRVSDRAIVTGKPYLLVDDAGVKVNEYLKRSCLVHHGRLTRKHDLLGHTQTLEEDDGVNARRIVLWVKVDG